jgi:hypothetical protein
MKQKVILKILFTEVHLKIQEAVVFKEVAVLEVIQEILDLEEEDNDI